MAKHGLYMARGKGCHSNLQGYMNDERPWHRIADTENILLIGISWSGNQYVRYEDGWRKEHKIKDSSCSIPNLHSPKRQWMSEIEISSTINHLSLWEENMIDDDNLATFSVESNPSDFRIATGGMYSTGTGIHEDESNARRSALLIVHNEGFLIRQEGISDEHQSPGTIVIIHPHEPHQLQKNLESAQRWAAIFFDYEKDLSLMDIENGLQEAYKRIFIS
ncbi:hypothetical protein [Allocoleopsis sp.]|uniref:hypothetical protein n=1 Tax=Allocoleopsis sp. TaxID=3088169 RepID=UPI002FD12750